MMYSPGIALTIARALIRSMEAEEIVRNFDFTFKQYYKIRLELLERLEKLYESNPATVHQIRLMVNMLLEQESSTAYRKRYVLDRTISQLLQHLPIGEQLVLVDKFLQARRASRRKIAFQIIRQNYLPDHKQLLLNCFEHFNDEWALTTLTRVNSNIVDIAVFLLHNLDERYERARVFEKLCSQNYALASSLAIEHPLAFSWGAARAEWTDAIPKIIEIVTTNKVGYENIGLVIWSFGKLGAVDILKDFAEAYKVDIHNFPHFS